MFLHSDYVQLLQKAMQKVDFRKMFNGKYGLHRVCHENVCTSRVESRVHNHIGNFRI